MMNHPECEVCLECLAKIEKVAHGNGASRERARLIAFIRDIPGVEELPTVWAFCQDLASRIERDGQSL